MQQSEWISKMEKYFQLSSQHLLNLHIFYIVARTMWSTQSVMGLNEAKAD